MRGGVKKMSLSDKREKIISKIEDEMYSKLSDKDYCWLIEKVTDLWMLNKQFIKELKEGYAEDDPFLKRIDELAGEGLI